MPQYRNAFRGSVQTTNLVFPEQFNNQGGGNKKAGLPDGRNRPYGFPIALKVATTGQVVRGLRFTFHPHRALKPIWSTMTPNPYFIVPGTNIDL